MPLFAAFFFQSLLLNSFAAMPRLTKAQLEDRIHVLTHFSNVASDKCADLEKENEQLKRRISRGHDRSRSPRRPASSSQAHMEMTCKALNQVRSWQRDTVVDEQKEEIARLRALVAEKDEQIASLRRGEGAVGPVLDCVGARQQLDLRTTRACTRPCF